MTEAEKWAKRKDTRNAVRRRENSLPPETESVMALHKEPLKPVVAGYGYQGTLAYNKNQTHTQCHLCGDFYVDLSHHLYPAHGLSAREYRIAYGLPTTISLTAPKANNHHYQVWQNLTPEERAKRLAKLHPFKPGENGIERGAGDRGYRKPLYKKNLEGKCPDQLLDKIERLAKKSGRTPRKKDFITEYNHSYYDNVILTYGSWEQALTILSLTPNSRGGKPVFSKEVLVKLLIEFRDRYGREPMYSDTERGLLPSGPTFVRHFGSWTGAKEYAK